MIKNVEDNVVFLAQLKIISFEHLSHLFLIRQRCVREQITVNQTCNFTNKGSFEITSTDPLLGFNNRRQMRDIF